MNIVLWFPVKCFVALRSRSLVAGGGGRGRRGERGECGEGDRETGVMVGV